MGLAQIVTVVGVVVVVVLVGVLIKLVIDYSKEWER